MFDVDDDRLDPWRKVGRGRADLVPLLLADVAAERPLAQPAMDRVLMVGDLHGNAAAVLTVLRRWVPRFGITTVVQVGDFGVWGSAAGEGYLDVLGAALTGHDATLVFADGNHEDFVCLDRFPVVAYGPNAGLRPVRPRIWHLPRGTRWRWDAPDGTPRTWLAVGGAASVDASLRTPGESWWPEEELTQDEADAAALEGPADVVVCHDRPAAAHRALGQEPGAWHERAPKAWARVDLERSDAHAARVQGVVDAVRPSHCWHGHLHERTEVLLDPAAWGGACRVHGLADDAQPGGNVALAGTDGALIR